MLKEVSRTAREAAGLVLDPAAGDTPAKPALFDSTKMGETRDLLKGSIVWMRFGGTDSWRYIPTNIKTGDQKNLKLTVSKADNSSATEELTEAAMNTAGAVRAMVGCITSGHHRGARATTLATGMGLAVTIEPVLSNGPLEAVQLKIGGTVVMRKLNDLEAIMGPNIWEQWAGTNIMPPDLRAAAGVPTEVVAIAAKILLGNLATGPNALMRIAALTTIGSDIGTRGVHTGVTDYAGFVAGLTGDPAIERPLAVVFAHLGAGDPGGTRDEPKAQLYRAAEALKSAIGDLVDSLDSATIGDTAKMSASISALLGVTLGPSGVGEALAKSIGSAEAKSATAAALTGATTAALAAAAATAATTAAATTAAAAAAGATAMGGGAPAASKGAAPPPRPPTTMWTETLPFLRPVNTSTVPPGAAWEQIALARGATLQLLADTMATAVGRPPAGALFAGDTAEEMAISAEEDYAIILKGAGVNFELPPHDWREAGNRLRQIITAYQNTKIPPGKPDKIAFKDAGSEADPARVKIVRRTSMATSALSCAASIITQLTEPGVVEAEAAADHSADPIDEARRIVGTSYGDAARALMSSDGSYKDALAGNGARRTLEHAHPHIHKTQRGGANQQGADEGGERRDSRSVPSSTARGVTGPERPKPGMCPSGSGSNRGRGDGVARGRGRHWGRFGVPRGRGRTGVDTVASDSPRTVVGEADAATHP